MVWWCSPLSFRGCPHLFQAPLRPHDVHGPPGPHQVRIIYINMWSDRPWSFADVSTSSHPAQSFPKNLLRIFVVHVLVYVCVLHTCVHVCL
jgi:hypothetical protein